MQKMYSLLQINEYSMQSSVAEISCILSVGMQKISCSVADKSAQYAIFYSRFFVDAFCIYAENVCSAADK